MPLFSNTIFDYSSENEIRASLKNIDNNMGKIISYKSTGFNINTNNGVTKATFSYKVIYDKGVMTDSIGLIKENNSYKIYFYNWQMR